MTVVEDYTLTGPSVEEADLVLAGVQHKLHDELGYELGFQQQWVGSAAGARMFYGEPISPKELNVWKAFLPNRYSHLAGNWSQCDPDLVPPEVMERAHLAHHRRVFDDLQIWSAAPSDIDPMLVGSVKVRGVWHFFKIARWGESLASFEAIEEVIKLRQEFVRTFVKRGVLVWALAVVIATTITALFVPTSLLGYAVFGAIVLLCLGLFYSVNPIRRSTLERRAIRRFKPEIPEPTGGLTTAVA
jgi:hypothetical protein